MARHQADLVRCAQLPGVAVGRVCVAHDGRCVACDSMVRPSVPARVCDGCCGGGGGFGPKRCLVCGGGGGGGGERGGGGAPAAAAVVADAYYCKACVQMEKDREGCPAVVNAGAARRDAAFYKRNKARRTTTSLLRGGVIDYGN